MTAHASWAIKIVQCVAIIHACDMSSVNIGWFVRIRSKLFSCCSCADPLYPHPEPGREDQAGQVVHAVWWWWEAEADWRGSCRCDSPWCQTHQLCRGATLLTFCTPLFIFKYEYNSYRIGKNIITRVNCCFKGLVQEMYKSVCLMYKSMCLAW